MILVASCYFRRVRQMRHEKMIGCKRMLGRKWLGDLWMGLIVFGLVVTFASSAFAVDDSADVEKAFVKFQHEWIQKLNRYGNYGKKHVEVKEDKDHQGVYIASYLELSDPFEYRIKQTGQKGSPYVGVIRYRKMTYASRGKTPEEASAGNYKCEHQSIVTEIFRYSGGKWVY